MIDSLILIFVGATILAALAMFVRQPLIVVYILVGVVLGPHALGWVDDTELLAEVSELGILFLLFVVGLELPPNKLASMFGTSMIAALLSSVLFFAIGYCAGLIFGFAGVECIVLGVALMFSSTVLGVKLLPRTILHHRKIGELVIGILLIQDLIAVATLVVLYLFGDLGDHGTVDVTRLFAAGPVLLLVAFLGPKFVIWPLMRRFDVYTEFMFLLYIGWCLALASIGYSLGLGFELGAFVAGVSLANSPVSQSLAESLEPIRDFFLVMFFFTVGARVDILLVPEVIWQSAILTAVLVAVKPVVFRYLLAIRRIPGPFAWEVGIRLGQCSEFSLLVLFVAAPLLSKQTDHIILLTTIMTIVVSTYMVVLNFRSPLAISEKLRVD